jgi:uncharacterized membrane protein (UPF0127 family)
MVSLHGQRALPGPTIDRVIPAHRHPVAPPGRLVRLRRRTRPARRLLASAGALVVLLAACGDGSSAPTADSPAAGPPAAAEAPPSPPPTTGAEAPASPAASPTTAPNPAPTVEPTPAEPVASTASIPLAELPRVEFVRADGGAVALPVEIPPRSDYGLGLSGRYQLEGRGMVFHYPQGTSAIGFYMKNTHIDLSIAFVGLDDRVIAIREMVAESLDLVRPGGVYRYAIEAPAGWYAARGIGEGALLRLPPDVELPE